MHIEMNHQTDGDAAEMLVETATAAPQTNRSTMLSTSRAASQTIPHPRSRRGSTEYDLLLGRLLQQSGHYSTGLFIGFAGCNRRSGVSTIAANIAIRAADLQNGSVLLVEANTDYPRQRRHFGIVEGPGLVEVLGGSVALDDAIAPTRVQGLSLLGSRTRNRMAPLAVMEGAVDGFIKEIRNNFSVVVFDFPSDESLSNWRPLLQSLDSTILVIASEETTPSDIQRTQNQFLIDNVKISGTVLNRYRSYIPWFLRRR